MPLHHVTIRVPWHEGGWTGRVCTRPQDNLSCLILPRIGEGRRDDVEARCASRRLDELDRADLPPCVSERVSFMAPFALPRTMTHLDTEFYPETYGHFEPTRFVQPAYSAACEPIPSNRSQAWHVHAAADATMRTFVPDTTTGPHYQLEPHRVRARGRGRRLRPRRAKLIEGAIPAAGPQGSQHFTGIELVVDALRRTFGVGHRVRVQVPLAAGEDSEPEPDVAVVAGDARDFRDGHPTTALLVVEVSDDSLRHDRTVKQRLYARCGIPPLTIPFDSHALAARERCTWGRPRGSAGDPA